MTALPSGLAPLILQGHVIDRLRELPDDSIQCVTTSPPFFGLRRYDICGCSIKAVSSASFEAWGGSERTAESTGQYSASDPRAMKDPDPSCPWCHGTGKIEGMNDVLWGGSAQCAHEWDTSVIPSGNGQTTHSMIGATLNAASATRSPRASTSCARCGAWKGQFGLEPTVQMYIAHAVEVFREVRRVLRDDGTCWVEIGDSYASNPLKGGSGTPNGRNGRGEDYQRAGLGGIAPKNLMLVPQRLAIAFQDDGWIVRSIVIWHRQNPMPESVRDRPTQSHSYILMLTKSPRYFHDADAVREDNAPRFREPIWVERGPTKPMGSPGGNGGLRQGNAMAYNGLGRNLRSVWVIPTKGYPGAHFATFPESLPERCILASTSEKGACPKCGAPWERITSCDYVVQRSSNIREQPKQAGKVLTGASSERGFVVASATRVSATLGWEPTCSCGESDTVPCTVLDPFAGSGTTLAVAKRLGRTSVGIEMNTMYVSLIRQRVAEAITESAHHPSQRRLVEFEEAPT